MFNNVRNWFNWKRFWQIHGWIQMGLVFAFLMLSNLPMAYASSVAAMAFFGLADCKRG